MTGAYPAVVEALKLTLRPARHSFMRFFTPLTTRLGRTAANGSSWRGPRSCSKCCAPTRELAAILLADD
jgi:hypothetical protein